MGRKTSSFEVVSRRETPKSGVFATLFTPSPPKSSPPQRSSTASASSTSASSTSASSPPSLNDPVFSKDPSQNPLVVANPDPVPHFSYSSSSSSSSSSSNDTTPSTSATSFSSDKKSPIVLTYDPVTSTELTVTSDGSLISAIPVPTEAPPPYRRHVSTPVVPLQPESRPDLPPRAVTAPLTPLKKQHPDRSLDPIDEMDESNPFGVSLHQSGPFDVIRAVTRPKNTRTSSPRNGSTTGYTNTHLNHHSFDPVSAVPYIPFAGPLNLSPGQILPRNFAQPQPAPQSHSYQPGHRRAPEPHAYHLKPPAPPAAPPAAPRINSGPSTRMNPSLTLHTMTLAVEPPTASPPLPTPNYPTTPTSPSPFPLPSPGFPPTPVTSQPTQTQAQTLNPPSTSVAHTKLTSTTSTASYHSTLTSPTALAHSPSASSFHTVDAYGGIDEDSSPQAVAYSDLNERRQHDKEHELNLHLKQDSTLRDEDYDVPSYSAYDAQRPSIEQSHSPYSLLDDKDAVEKHVGSGGYFPVQRAEGSTSRHLREGASAVPDQRPREAPVPNQRLSPDGREATSPVTQIQRPLSDDPLSSIPPHQKPHQPNGVLKTSPSKHHSMPVPNTPVMDGAGFSQQQRGYGEAGPGPSSVTYQNQQQQPRRSLPANDQRPQQQQQYPLPPQHQYAPPAPDHKYQQPQQQQYPTPPPIPNQYQYPYAPSTRDPSIYSVGGTPQHLPRHAPKRLVMPMPLQSQGQGQQRVRFQHPSPPPRQQQPLQRKHTYTLPSSLVPTPQTQTQAQNIPIPPPPPPSNQNQKVLRKRGSVSGPLPGPPVTPLSGMGLNNDVSRSKTDAGGGGKKAPKRVLSKRRTLF
ncbi:hypothetical protein WG66_015101 [Moniliophthora roreri]|nr:hypothetical protein WG66_015101 [Moniliophthora roreri]